MFDPTAAQQPGQPTLPALKRGDMLLVELHQQPMLVYELETLGIVMANEATTTKFGYSNGELRGLTIADLCHEDDHERLAQNVAQVSEGIDRAGQWRIRRKDRSVVEVEINSLAITFEGRPAELVLMTDITAMMHAERTSRESEQALRSLLQSIKDIIFVLDKDKFYRKIYTSSVANLLSPPDALIGKYYKNLLPPHTHKAVEDAFDLLDSGTVDFAECSYDLGEGEEKTWWNARITRHRSEEESGYIVVVREVTGAKRAEDELRADDELLEIVARHSLALLGAPDGDRAMLELFGAIGEALRVDRVYLFDASPREPGTGEIFSSQLAEWAAAGISPQIDNPALKRVPMVAAGFGRWLIALEAGEFVQALVREMTEPERALLEPQGILALMMLPIHIHGQLAAMLGFDDCRRERMWTPREITVLTLAATAVGQLLARRGADRMRSSLEAQLRHSQKMEAFGQLASGVAHDFNNLITIIHMNVSMLQTDEVTPEDYGDTLRAIESATDRAANLTRQLLAFSRAQVMRVQPINPSHVILNTLQLLRRLLGENIQIETQLAPNLSPIMADEDMLSQVLINLALNARDAMGGGGRLSVLLQHAPKHALARTPYPPITGAIQLRVQDTGSGIAPEHLPRIFEPFFTTKEVGKGTGLGLATAFSIIAQHKGWIEVESAPGEGSRFDVFLPTIEATLRRPSTQAEPQSAGQGTILVVEDEPALREMARRFLQRRGYRVLEAGSGPEAIQLFNANSGQIDALFTDMILPGGMTGAECAALMLSKRPDLPVIYTSGYNSELLPSGLALEQGINYLQKPYTSQDLQRIFRARLAERG